MKPDSPIRVLQMATDDVRLSLKKLITICGLCSALSAFAGSFFNGASTIAEYRSKVDQHSAELLELREFKTAVIRMSKDIEYIRREMDKQKSP